MLFPVSGVEVFPLWPASCAFAISLLCSMSGVSGAFLLLPYQISVLGYASPGVSATNQIFNILACPAGVWRYCREGRLLPPLAAFIALGTLPGVFIGAVLRLAWLRETSNFMLFVGLVLLGMAARLLWRKPQAKNVNIGKCSNISWSWKQFSFDFAGGSHIVRTAPLMLLSLAVGIIGGVYGIGGGAIISPALVAFFRLPIYAIAGACLFATFLTSIAGVAFYSLLGCLWNFPFATPDWKLGAVLGIGGIGGMYLGAALQRRAPPSLLRSILLFILLSIAAIYIYKGLNI